MYYLLPCNNTIQEDYTATSFLFLFFISGDVQFGRTDLGFGNTFIMSELWGLMDTTSYYNYDGWCFLMAKPKPPANWLGKKYNQIAEAIETIRNT